MPRYGKVRNPKPGYTYVLNPITGKWIQQKPEKQPETKLPPPPELNEPPEGLSLAWPLLSGFVITQTFQEHEATRLREGYKYYNGGLDLAYGNVREGEPVYAASLGNVTMAGPDNTGYGNNVRVQHANGYVTLYAHLRDITVKVGQAVTPQTIIGHLGHTGNCWGGPGNPNGVHLHFELRYSGKPIDPKPYMIDR